MASPCLRPSPDSPGTIGIFMFYGPQSHAWLAGIVISSIAYGVVSVLFAETAFTLIQQARNGKGSRNWLFLTLSSIIYIFSTIFMCAGGLFAREIVVTLVDGTCLGAHSIKYAGLVSFLFSNLFMDGLLVSEFCSHCRAA